MTGQGIGVRGGECGVCSGEDEPFLAPPPNPPASGAFDAEAKLLQGL